MLKTMLASLVRIHVPSNPDTLFVCLTSALKSTPAAEVNANNVAIGVVWAGTKEVAVSVGSHVVERVIL